MIETFSQVLILSLSKDEEINVCAANLHYRNKVLKRDSTPEETAYLNAKPAEGWQK